MGQAISNIFGDGKDGRDENSYQETKRRVVVEGRRGSDGTQQTIPNSFQPNPNWDWEEILNSSRLSASSSTEVVQSSRRVAIVQECGQIGGTQQNVPISLHPELKSSSNTRLSTCPTEVEDSSRIRVVEESGGSGGIQKNILKNLRSELESRSKTWISTCSSKVEDSSRIRVVAVTCGSGGTQQNILRSLQFELEPSSNIRPSTCSSKVEDSSKIKVVEESGGSGGTQQNIPKSLQSELESCSNTRLPTCSSKVEDSRVVEESGGSGGTQQNILRSSQSELESSSNIKPFTCLSKVEDSSKIKVVENSSGSGGTQQNIPKSLQSELKSSSNTRLYTCSSKVEDSSKIKVVEKSGGSGGAQQNVPKSTRRKRPSKKERMHSSSNDTRLYASSSTEVVESRISVAIVQECDQTGGTQQNVPKSLHPELKPSSDTSRRVVEESGDSGGTHQNILKSLQSQFESSSNTRLSTCSSKVEDSSRIKVVEESGGTQQNVPKSSRRKRPSKKERMHSSGNDTRQSTSYSTKVAKVDVSSKRVVEESGGNGGTLQNVFKSSKKKPRGNKKILHSSSNDTVLSTSSTEVQGSSRRVVEESSGNALLSTHWQQQQIYEPPTAGSVSKVLVATMAVTFYNFNSQSGLNKLDEFLLTRSYISGYQASKDDITVHAALSSPPLAEYVNASRWYKHIDALLRISGVFGEGSGVTVEGFAPVAEEVATPAVIDSKADDDHSDDDVDLFGEETEEEKKVAEERAVAIKASRNKKESGKLSILLDVKPCSQGGDTQQSISKSLQLELKSSSNTRLNTCLHSNGRVVDDNGQSGGTQQNVPKSSRRKPRCKEILHSSNNARLSTSNNSGFLCRWIAPPAGWVSLNTDGALNHANASCGGLIRDNKGKVLQFYHAAVDRQAIHLIELQAIAHGLRVALEGGRGRIWVQSDSKSAIDIINGEYSPPCNSIAIVDEIKKKMEQFEEIRFSHVFREMNKPADLIAKWGFGDLSIYSHPIPKKLDIMVEKDAKGTWYFRKYKGDTDEMDQ